MCVASIVSVDSCRQVGNLTITSGRGRGCVHVHSPDARARVCPTRLARLRCKTIITQHITVSRRGDASDGGLPAPKGRVRNSWNPVFASEIRFHIGGFL